MVQGRWQKAYYHTSFTVKRFLSLWNTHSFYTLTALSRKTIVSIYYTFYTTEYLCLLLCDSSLLIIYQIYYSGHSSLQLTAARHRTTRKVPLRQKLHPHRRPTIPHRRARIAHLHPHLPRLRYPDRQWKWKSWWGKMFSVVFFLSMKHRFAEKRYRLGKESLIEAITHRFTEKCMDSFVHTVNTKAVPNVFLRYLHNSFALLSVNKNINISPI